MNRKELIDRIIERLYNKYDYADLTKILEEELPDKYNLHPSEWWQDCDKFRVKSGNVLVSRGYKVMKDGSAYLLGERTGAYNVKECQHFIEPTIEQKFINSLTPEQMVMYKELNNENHNSGK